MCVFYDDDDDDDDRGGDDCSLSPSTAALSFDALWKRLQAAELGNMMMKNHSVCAGVSVFSQRISEGKPEVISPMKLSKER